MDTSSRVNHTHPVMNAAHVTDHYIIVGQLDSVLWTGYAVVKRDFPDKAAVGLVLLYLALADHSDEQIALSGLGEPAGVAVQGPLPDLLC